MHDPHTQAFEIKNPFAGSDERGYRPVLIRIWHKDPENDGTDDSCGWFIRSRHLDPALMENIRKNFEFEFEYWFNNAGYPTMSTIATVVNMYSRAAWTIFIFEAGGKPTDRAYRKYLRFMRKYTFDIIKFAENPTDSLNNSINMKYGVEKKEERVRHFVSVVGADIMRKRRPWYKHPRWHIHHWRIQMVFLQNIKRRYWDKCCLCGKRGFKSAAIGDRSGNRWHQECENKNPKPNN
jgi:hypothetical protein